MRLGRASAAVESSLLTNGVNFAILALYASANLLLFVHNARLEYHSQEDFRRYTTAFARGCGATLNLNFATILLISSRSVISFLRETPISRYASLDHLMPGIHSVIGVLIVLAATGHAFAHMPTYIILRTWGPGYDGGTALFATGTFLSFMLILIRVSALESVRRSHYEAFRYCHVGGSLVTFAFLCIHGLHRGDPSSWKWVIGPSIVYAFDRIVRVIREKRSYLFISKHSAIFQGRSVLRLRLPRVFHFQPGQFAELKVPAISRHQWHPFTIASAPHEAEMIFYIKAAGNWTTELMLLFAERLGVENAEDIEVHISGPFGAPVQQVDRFDRLVLIGGGVGSTPFCSVVKSLDHWMTHWAHADRNTSDDTTNQHHLARHSTEHNVAATSASGETLSRQGYNSAEKQDTFVTAPDFPITKAVQATTTRFAAETSANPSSPGNKCHMDNGRKMKVKEVDISIRSDGIAASIRSSIKARGKPRQKPGKMESGERLSATGDWEFLSRGSKASGSFWRAMNSLSLLDEHPSTIPAYRDSLDQLIGMSFGSHRLIEHLQNERRQASATLLNDLNSACAQRPNEQSTIDDEFSVFHDRRVQLLMYLKSVTASVCLLFLLISRLIVAAIASIFQLLETDVTAYGISIYKDRPFVIIDAALSCFFALGVGVPSILQGLILHFRGPVPWIDMCLLTPSATFAAVLNIIALLAPTFQFSTIFKMLSLFIAWPLTYILFLIRFFTAIGERIALGEPSGRRDLAKTKSVDFLWTSPTPEDDQWLVDELSIHVKSSRTKLNRFITRVARPKGPPEEEKEDVNFVTTYGRPRWADLFNSVAERSENGSTVGIFLCGPASMADEVQEAVNEAMRNSIVRGLQHGGATGMKRLEEIFGDSVSANQYTGETLETAEDGSRRGYGCNVKMVFHKERFS